MYRRLRDLREDSDLSQKALAAALHISQATYSRYENGVLDVPSAVLVALSRHYHVSVDYLLGLTDDPLPYPPGKLAPPPSVNPL